MTQPTLYLRQAKWFDIDTGPRCPFFVSAALLPPDGEGIRRVASGRGKSRQEARQRCASEAIERLCAIHDRNRTLISASYANVVDKAVNPASFTLFSENQYRSRDEWNATASVGQEWPGPFDPERTIEWASARWLCGREEVLLPAAYAFLGYRHALETGFPVPDSSGLAAGPTMTDAVQYALLELIERDAVSIWWYNRIKREPFIVDHEKMTMFPAFQEWVDFSDRMFWLLDLTSDLKIPVAAAITSDGNGSDISLGFGAGWSAEEAAESAMGELVQFEVTKKMQETSRPHGPRNFISLAKTLTRDIAPYLWPVQENDSLRPRAPSDVVGLLDRLSARLLKPLVLDLSRNGVSVVRVVVPRLRPVWPRFAPGRLFDVPVERGWLATPNAEENLNPLPIIY
ncbi:YcaO-like family protein [Mesorhizobium mediterraneum]|uniref:YcaO-like family protein n=1 Tax=Mesorhizobium mediterraneum TaxID=43617 RepID=UPI00177DCAE7|nr:YcaO-like family protein [Mesorhizobium mediterraneum]